MGLPAISWLISILERPVFCAQSGAPRVRVDGALGACREGLLSGRPGAMQKMNMQCIMMLRYAQELNKDEVKLDRIQQSRTELNRHRRHNSLPSPMLDLCLGP